MQTSVKRISISNDFFRNSGLLASVGLTIHVKADTIGNRSETCGESKFVHCHSIHEVREWLRENFLLFNDNKTEVVIFGKDTTEKQLQIGKSVISSRSAATSLGCILDSKLNMSQHVSRVCKSANYLTLH